MSAPLPTAAVGPPPPRLADPLDDPPAVPGEPPPGPAHEARPGPTRSPEVEHLTVETDGGRADRDGEFTAFVRRHQQDLLRTAWLLVGDTHRAEEMTQQALVRTYGAWSRARRDPLAYARRVLVNLRIDTWRRRRREVLVAPEDVPDGPGPDPSTADRSADRDQLVRALALLSPRQRRVVVLRHFVGLPEQEVADDLGVSVGTVKSTSSRALADLRRALRAAESADGAATRQSTSRSHR